MGNIPYEAPKSFPPDDLVGGVVTVNGRGIMVDKKIAQGTDMGAATLFTSLTASPLACGQVDTVLCISHTAWPQKKSLY